MKDRHENDFCLGPTHEEVFTDLIAGEVKSWKQLPISLYQVGKKYRDEIRPRFGLLRSREFIMKDCYSFHLDKNDAETYYHNMVGAYGAILDQLECPWVKVEADSGNIGGNLSHEFHIHSDIGEDELLSCSACSYAANTEKATGGVRLDSSDHCDVLEAVKITPKVSEVDSLDNIVAIIPRGRAINPLKLKLQKDISIYVDDNCAALATDAAILKVLSDNSIPPPPSLEKVVGDYIQAAHGDSCKAKNCQVITETLDRRHRPMRALSYTSTNIVLS